MAERERLESLAVPDAAAAEERAWAVVSDAYAHRRPRRRRSHAAIIAPLVVLVVAAAVAAAVAATPQGATVATWVERTLGISKPVPRSSIGPLPAGGRLLVTSRGGAFVVASDGSRTRLGDYTGATWSPHGLFIGAWRGRRLSAVAPDGRVAWSYLARGRVRAMTWSPDGYRIAYLSGPRLAVVAGDGSGARLLDARPQAVAPAWRPTEPHTLAWVASDGRVVVRDVDGGRFVWRSAGSVGGATELLWSADGRRLLAVAPHVLRVLDVHGNRVWRLPAGPGRRVRAAAWAPVGHRVAVVLDEHSGLGTVVVTDRLKPGLPGRRIFRTTGRLGPVSWSPDARTVLVGWGDADGWLFLRASGGGRPAAVAPLSHRFGGRPAVRGWCCAR